MAANFRKDFMSADLTLSDVPGDSDLPRRTWRQWWRQLSAWRRMFVWAGLGFVVVHVALAARLFVGQWEAREIRALRARNVFVQYVWEKKPERFFLDHWLLAGMHGKSCASVIDLRLPEIATDADLELIGKYFHQLRSLNVRDSYISSQAVNALQRCRRLEVLNLSNTEVTSAGLAGIRDCVQLVDLDLRYTDIDDEGVAQLINLRKLRGLDLRSTLVTDACISSLEQLPDLQVVFVGETEISPPTSSVSRPGWMVSKNWNGKFPRPDEVSRDLIGVIRWADGARSGRFNGPFKLTLQGTAGHPPLHHTGIGLTRDMLSWTTGNTGFRDGDCLYLLQLGEYESEPVRITVQRGVPSQNVIEFRMPVTKEKALQDQVERTPSGGR
jgi:hypothetical protein